MTTSANPPWRDCAAARLGPDLHHRHLRVVVEIERQSRLCSARPIGPVRLRQITRAPFRSTPRSAARMRCVSSRCPISKLKNSTGCMACCATWAAMLSANAVFPMLGRAPTMFSVDGWSPESSSSRSVKPVGTPVSALPRFVGLLQVRHRRLQQLGAAGWSRPPVCPRSGRPCARPRRALSSRHPARRRRSRRSRSPPRSGDGGVRCPGRCGA